MKPMLALFGAAAASAASDVHDLKLDNFEPFMKNHSLVLAECKLSGLAVFPLHDVL